jgi:hypothetical protein
MRDREKLRVLVPHWIEHNGQHAQEFREWAERAGAARESILAAAELVEKANVRLEEALEALGGAAEHDHSHDHGHDHD